MFVIKYALENPVKVLVAVLFILLFGIQALFNMPYQLSPNVEYPTITVRTSWAGATPYEMEREVVEPQENVLKSLAGLIEMESTSSNGTGTITLQFKLGMDLMEAMLLVTNKLNEVRRYPDNVNKPVIRASGADTTPIVYMVFEILEGNDRSIDSYRTYVSEEIIPKFERIEGVSEVNFWGGRSSQMHIVVNPEKMAAYSVGIDQLVSVLNRQNINISAGLLPVGRKNYRVRTVAEFISEDDIRETLVFSESGGVKISDLATVEYGYATADSAVRYGDNRTMMVAIVSETGANVLEVTDLIEEAVKELNAGELLGQGLSLQWIYDQRPYINGAIGLVKSNILVGGILAILTLLVFLRRAPSTLIIAIAIPISVIGTFIILRLLGRTLNVISLAGIAFAVGMLIDNAIVVLENIDRHMKMGKTIFKAAFDGVSEVWGAVLASTLTTIAVFLPVVFIKEESGQLFRDIAIAISSAVTLSLLVSVFVIPVLTKIIYERLSPKEPGRLSVRVGEIGGKATTAIMKLSVWINNSTSRKIAVAVSFTVFSILTVILLMPKMEYLPQGNMNMVQSNFIVPSGLSLDERSDLANIFYNETIPYIGQSKDGQPAIAHFTYSVYPNGMFAMAVAEDQARAYELVTLMTGLMRKVPGVGGFTTQSGIFQNRGNGSRSMNVVISGEDINKLVTVSRSIMQSIQQAVPGAQVRPRPSLELMYPEATFRPKNQQLADAGLNATSLGNTVDVFVDGWKIGEFRDDYLGNIDLLLTYPTTEVDNPEDLASMPMAVQGGIIPISNVADLTVDYGLDGIRRYERKRAYTLTVSPPSEIVLEEVMDRIDTIIEPLKKDGTLDFMEVRYTGSASKLTEARNALMGNFVLALIITYLLMAALFDNFFYPLIIMFSVPLAMAGGFIGLKLVDIFIAQQPLDILTMLGFVILVGVVVNNAILIVHQTLNNIRMYNFAPQEAITEAVNSRLRPIFMGAATSLFGMLPLVVFPGPGSELYRGLGSVVLGGLTISTLFTVFLVPALLSLSMKFLKDDSEKQSI